VSSATAWDLREEARRRIAAESGPPRRTTGVLRVALAYPSPYRLAMASLGYQAILAAFENSPGVYCDRAFLPDSPEAYQRVGLSLFGYETGKPVGTADMVAASVAWELELVGLANILFLSGLEPLAAARPDDTPPVVLGGPLTYADPRPLYPFGDVIVVGEGEEAAAALADISRRCPAKTSFLAEVSKADLPGVVVPKFHGDAIPPRAIASANQLPARSIRVSPEAEFPNMFLVEAARGCGRRCSYCVMAASSRPGPRFIPGSVVLQTIPSEAKRIGLVGASVSDHPDLIAMLQALAEQGCEVGLSSMRADRLSPELLDLLVRCGLKTVTTALDGSSQRVRDSLRRGTNARHLMRCAELAGERQLRLKIYVMIGVPGEEERDIDELAELLLELSTRTRTTVAISPFVPKRGTILEDAPFGPRSMLQSRMARLRRHLAGRIEIREASPKWAWVEASIATGGIAAGIAARDAALAGGNLAAWKSAFKIHAVPNPESSRSRSLHRAPNR